MTRTVYDLHERLWHWLQAAAALGLLATGALLHRGAGLAPLGAVARVHEALGAFLVLNAGLGLFYYATSGAVRQLLPGPPRDFGSLALAQARYYLWGMLRGEPHPFERTPGRRLNPLQKVTYLAILNGLLPLLVVTGGLLWARERVAALAGLPTRPLLAAHLLGAWLLGAFVVAHVYLTTTGPTLLAHLRTMVTGEEEVAPTPAAPPPAPAVDAAPPAAPTSTPAADAPAAGGPA